MAKAIAPARPVLIPCLRLRDWRDQSVPEEARDGCNGEAEEAISRDYIRGGCRSLDDPAAADDNIPVVENGGLARSDGPLRLVEGDKNFIAILTADFLEQRRGGLVTVANL